MRTRGMTMGTVAVRLRSCEGRVGRENKVSSQGESESGGGGMLSKTRGSYSAVRLFP